MALDDILESPARSAPEAFPSLEDSHDFAVASPDSPIQRVRFGDDPVAGTVTASSSAPDILDTTIKHTDTGLSRTSVSGRRPPSTSSFRARRPTRTSTFRNIQDYTAFEPREGWHPGSEPGVDPNKQDGGRAGLPKLSAACQITVVDISPDQIQVVEFENDEFIAFMDEPQPAWSKCRWISVNGLDWNVIRELGKRKRLHSLALEDVMNTRNRTKTDWYSNHAYLVFTMQKLVRLLEPDSEDDDTLTADDESYVSGSDFNKTKKSMFSQAGRKVRRMVRRRKPMAYMSNPAAAAEKGAKLSPQSTSLSDSSATFKDVKLRTLQRYNESPNQIRTLYMEKHSALASRQLAVIAEQVSLFITNDNTLISFFELSADDIEKPILSRLYTEDTILRQSCDASLIAQAIVDAVIDMAIPVSSAYADVVGDLELDVLTKPTVVHTKSLYILITEVNKILSFIVPITSLINSLRDHKTDLSQENALAHLQDPKRGVLITPTAHIYLKDVLDHTLLITDTLQGIKSSANGLIDLIFNTISAQSNDTMQQLTLATLFFLPLTFLTGYFGQNFQPFDDLDRGVNFFWIIAGPMCFFTILVLMREQLIDWVRTTIVRRSISQFRKARLDLFQKQK